MDNLSFMFSLLLIVSVTTITLGSAIKAKNRNGEQLDALLERSKHSNPRMNWGDQDSEMQKRLERTITLVIDNESGYKWERPSYYFHYGTWDDRLPYDLNNGSTLQYHARETYGSAKGIAGVVAFDVPPIDITIAFMFTVPFDYNLYENLWNVKLYEGGRLAGEDMYEDMSYPIPADPCIDLGSGLECKGVISTSGQSTLEIRVLRKKSN